MISNLSDDENIVLQKLCNNFTSYVNSLSMIISISWDQHIWLIEINEINAKYITFFVSVYLFIVVRYFML